MSETPRHVERARAALELQWDAQRQGRVAVGLRKRIRRRRVIRAAGSAAALVFVGVLAVFAQQSGRDGARGGEALADGSVIERLVPDSDVTVTQSTPELTEVRLRRGAARFRVAKNPRRTFRVDAGTVRVEVLGTTFLVEQRADGVHVEVTEGRVRVLSGETETVLRAGDARDFSAAPPAERAELAPAEAPSEAPLDTLPTEAPSKDVKAKHRPVAERSFDAEALLHSAEAARAAREPRAAMQPLLVLLNHRPADPHAAEAAFMLGRILQDDLGRPAAAAERFAQARSLAPGAPMAEDALARQVECTVASGVRERALELLRDYDGAYPRGVHGARLHKLVGE